MRLFDSVHYFTKDVLCFELTWLTIILVCLKRDKDVLQGINKLEFMKKVSAF